MKKIRVFGHTEVTVSVLIEVADDEVLTENEIYDRASKSFGGIYAFLGNGGDDKLIGVYKPGETIAADEAPTFDDYMELPANELSPER